MINEALGAFSALLFILALLGILAWSVRRFGLLPGQPRIKPGQKQVDIIESRMVDGRNRLLVVKWRGKEYLLASNPDGITHIDSQESDTLDFEKMVNDEKTD